MCSRAWIEKYSFQYSGVMDDALKSLPLGNGDIGANVWISPDGKMHLLLSKNDSWSELYRILKLAHVIMTIEPCPFETGATFDLQIADGVLSISHEKTHIQIYVDAFAPCIRFSWKAESSSNVKISLENYRSVPIDPKKDPSNYFMRGGAYSIAESADVLQKTPFGGVAQIHRNTDSCYEFSLHNQDMDPYIGKEKDPLLGYTFGVAIYSPDLMVVSNSLEQKNIRELNASIFVESRYTQNVGELIASLDGLYRRYGNASKESFAKHAKSWRAFWEKAYIYASGDENAERITRAFLYQRYITRCADRGNVPIKYNGSLFATVQMGAYPENYDGRRWGAPYWFQNTRLIYWYLLLMGDYDSVLPFFDMYLKMIPIATARCKTYFGHPGLLIPETVSFFGLYANGDYGFENEDGIRVGNVGDKLAIRRGEPGNRYIRYHYNGMLELSWMMLNYLKLSGDLSRRSQMMEFIEQVLLFFDNHFDRLEGKLLLNPVSSLETWQLCVNDAPDVAGLKAVCGLLNEMDLPETLRKLVDTMQTAIPDLPIEGADGKTVLAPCGMKIDAKPRNRENPELYSVFPFELYGVGKPDLEMARRTYDKRLYRDGFGWSQDAIDAALLGLVDDAVAHLVHRSAMTDARALFPGFWGPNYDETPDQDHGSVIALSLIFMLLQTNADTYTVFPAWPETWDVRFLLPLDRNYQIYGEQIKGKRKVVKQPNPTAGKDPSFFGTLPSD